MLFRSLPDELRAMILRKSEGNPFFVEEVIRTLIERGAIVRDPVAGIWQAVGSVEEIAIPDSLQALAARRAVPERDVRRVGASQGRPASAPGRATHRAARCTILSVAHDGILPRGPSGLVRSSTEGRGRPCGQKIESIETGGRLDDTLQQTMIHAAVVAPSSLATVTSIPFWWPVCAVGLLGGLADG